MANRPDWKRTNVNWERAVHIWERMAKGDTDSQVERWTEEEGPHSDRKTISLVRLELKGLPEAMAGELPVTIQEYRKKLRQQPNDEDTTGPIFAHVSDQSRHEAHQQDLQAEVERLLNQFQWNPRTSLEPSSGLDRRMFSSLREHLPGFLDGHQSAHDEYVGTRNRVSTDLKDNLESLLPGMPAGFNIHPWDQQLLDTLEQRTRYAKPGRTVLAEHRPYSPLPSGHQGKDFLPSWNGFNLTLSPISDDQYRGVHQIHLEFRDMAEKFVPILWSTMEKLNVEADELKGTLEELSLNHWVHGTCHLCDTLQGSQSA